MTRPPPATRRALLGLLAALPVAHGDAAQGSGQNWRGAGAEATAPLKVVDDFHAALLGVMREAARLGARGRYARLAPLMAAAFDLPAMTRIAVGPPWNGLTADQQARLTDAFSQWSVATYAARFDGYAGESFSNTGETTYANGDRLVRTSLNRTDGPPVVLSYLLRPAGPGGGWRIVDVYLTGTISELASRRAEFTAILRDGGADRLIADLQARTATLLA